MTPKTKLIIYANTQGRAWAEQTRRDCAMLLSDAADTIERQAARIAGVGGEDRRHWSKPHDRPMDNTNSPALRLIAALENDVLLRGQWTDGHERACALAWMSREVRDAEEASACPASLMPQWAAEVIPWMDDAPSAEAWPGLMRRLGGLIDRATPRSGRDVS
jgi:hypothetical protein